MHEMIHAFDHCRFEVDWGNLRHHACSEVSLASPEALVSMPRLLTMGDDRRRFDRPTCQATVNGQESSGEVSTPSRSNIR